MKRILRFTAAKFLILSSLALNISTANAALYTITFTYGSDTDAGPGTLTGSIDIDSTLLDGTENNIIVDSRFNSVPNWITAINLTLSGRTGNDAGANGTYTKTDIDRMAWTIVDNSIDFDPSLNFKNQMVRFGFDTTNGRLGLPSVDNPFDQEAGGGEFPLQSSVTTPGELPILGLGALIYYFKKLKNKTFKL